MNKQFQFAQKVQQTTSSNNTAISNQDLIYQICELISDAYDRSGEVTRNLLLVVHSKLLTISYKVKADVITDGKVRKSLLKLLQQTSELNNRSLRIRLN